jgi:protein-S-isoprenylcysteine O-methyltransferase Ste14
MLRSPAVSCWASFFFEMKNRISVSSIVLVGIQFTSLILIYITGPSVAQRMDLLIWELAGLVISIWGLFGLSWHSFSVFPEPKQKGKLITHGIYNYIRHPMYAGILILTGSLIIQFWSPLRFCSFLCLGLVFILKIRKEEALLSSRFPEFEEYKRRTNRLIPFVW